VNLLGHSKQHTTKNKPSGQKHAEEEGETYGKGEKPNLGIDKKKAAEKDRNACHRRQAEIKAACRGESNVVKGGGSGMSTLSSLEMW